MVQLMLKISNLMLPLNVLCKPVEGMRIKCKAVQITKAGIRALYKQKQKNHHP